MLEKLIEISHLAGDAIMEVYRQTEGQLEIDYKEDDSPLTLADRRAHEVIVRELQAAFPGIPILSEEGDAADYETRRSWKEYWIVDPLDGTKEFINRNGEFTVNIALVRDGASIAGVVHAPERKKTYAGDQDAGIAYVIEPDGKRSDLQVNHRESGRVAVRSKSHASDEELGVLDAYKAHDCVSVGSSLKFCLVADGTADVYYRHGPTMEWDVAAGMAVVQAAGGHVYHGVGPEPFRLTKPDLLNGSFLCVGCEPIPIDAAS
ncbi:MAG: 3'(2'),5'-bisphosphate nucleotidase CysQ [Planctomycetota bacterium]